MENQTAGRDADKRAVARRIAWAIRVGTWCFVCGALLLSCVVGLGAGMAALGLWGAVDPWVAGGLIAVAGALILASDVLHTVALNAHLNS